MTDPMLFADLHREQLMQEAEHERLVARARAWAAARPRPRPTSRWRLGAAQVCMRLALWLEPAQYLGLAESGPVEFVRRRASV